MAAYRDPATGKSTVFVAEGRKLMPNGSEVKNEFVDQVIVLDGTDAKRLAAIPVRRPKSVVARYGTLQILHQDEAGGYVVSSVPLAGGVPQGAPRLLFAVPATIAPFDLEQDSHGRFYLSDPKANKVYQLDGTGKILRTFGRLDVQKARHVRPGNLDVAGEAGDVEGPGGQRPVVDRRPGRPASDKRVERRRQAAAPVHEPSDALPTTTATPLTPSTRRTFTLEARRGGSVASRSTTRKRHGSLMRCGRRLARIRWRRRLITRV